MSLGIPETVGDNILSTTIPPCVGGWNTKDALISMPPEDAIELENLYPDNDKVNLRRGFRLASAISGAASTDIIDGLGVLAYGQTEYLVGYSSAQSELYNMSSGVASALTGAAPTNGAVNMLQFKDTLYFVSFDSTNDIYSWPGSGAVATPAFVGPGGDDKDIGVITSYRRRLYFGQRTSPILWYGAVDQSEHGGVNLNYIDLRTVLKLGGDIIIIGSTSRAKDFNEDSLFVIVSSRGEVLLYQGEYPGSATWGLVGQYFIPRPVGFKGFFYYGADLCIITRSGVVPMSEIIGYGQLREQAFLSYKIGAAFKAAATDALLVSPYIHNWMGLYYQRGNYVLINAPSEASQTGARVQFIKNMQTGAWTKFTGQTGHAWTLFNDRLYFGSNYGKVFKADEGDFDESLSSAGTAVDTAVKMRQALNYLGDYGKKKHFHFIRPIIKQDDGLNLTMGINVDYEDTVTTNTSTDTSDTSLILRQPLIKVSGLGRAFSLRQDQNMKNMTYEHYATEILYTPGGVR